MSISFLFEAYKAFLLVKHGFCSLFSLFFSESPALIWKKYPFAAAYCPNFSPLIISFPGVRSAYPSPAFHRHPPAEAG